MTEPMSVTATIEVDGDSLKDVVNRLYDLVRRLDEDGRTLPVQIVGGQHIVTVRESNKAPRIDWREAEGATRSPGRPSDAEDPAVVFQRFVSATQGPRRALSEAEQQAADAMTAAYLARVAHEQVHADGEPDDPRNGGHGAPALSTNPVVVNPSHKSGETA